MFLCVPFSDNRILSVSVVVILCLVYIRLRFPVLFKSVTISDVTILKNPWAIELKMKMLLWRLYFMLIVLQNLSRKVKTSLMKRRVEK